VLACRQAGEIAAFSRAQQLVEVRRERVHDGAIPLGERMTLAVEDECRAPAARPGQEELHRVRDAERSEDHVIQL
jgi:hypothetical protein